MSSIQRIAITGSSGYCGRYFIAQVRKRAPGVRILGLDMAPAQTDTPDEFQRIDTRDPKLSDALREFAPDTVVHMAFIVNETRSQQFMRDVNVNGSRNVFAAVKQLQPQRFLYYSSMVAFGAWPDNPVPMQEDWQLRPRLDFRYAADKTELEGDIVRFAAEHPEMAVSWIRPAMVLGQGTRNYISNYVLRSVVVLLPDGVDAPAQFVHEDDVARATWEVLHQNGRGAFNVCPDDWMPWSEIAKLRNLRAVKVPLWMSRWAIKTYRALRIPEMIMPGMGSPPGLLNFLRHPWVGTPKRLTEELGFKFQHSTRETFQQAWAQVAATKQVPREVAARPNFHAVHEDQQPSRSGRRTPSNSTSAEANKD
ncbi:MAG: galE 1 [Planctomycetaceae bacterium]|nr:galE 1 [Planctomycetaceae bacterium]